MSIKDFYNCLWSWNKIIVFNYFYLLPLPQVAHPFRITLCDSFHSITPRFGDTEIWNILLNFIIWLQTISFCNRWFFPPNTVYCWTDKKPWNGERKLLGPTLFEVAHISNKDSAYVLTLNWPSKPLDLDSVPASVRICFIKHYC